MRLLTGALCLALCCPAAGQGQCGGLQLGDSGECAAGPGDGPWKRAAPGAAPTPGARPPAAGPSAQEQFAELSWGENLPLLCLLALLMGLGKGGVPGSSTSSVALNALYAPELAGGLDLAAALQVPVTAMADVAVVARNFRDVDWGAVKRLMAPTVVGLAAGSQLMGRVDKDAAKALVGGILLAILLLNLLQARATAGGKGAAARPPPYATATWFACLTGLTGGFATILTNSMGPVLNVYLLTLRLEPFRFVGTRASFFTTVNGIKLVLRVLNGSLSPDMLRLGACLGVVSVVGVLLSRVIVSRLRPAVFARLEYTLMTYAGLKLLDAGLHLGVFDALCALRARIIGL